MIQIFSNEAVIFRGLMEVVVLHSHCRGRKFETCIAHQIRPSKSLI